MIQIFYIFTYIKNGIIRNDSDFLYIYIYKKCVG